MTLRKLKLLTRLSLICCSVILIIIIINMTQSLDDQYDINDEYIVTQYGPGEVTDSTSENKDMRQVPLLTQIKTQRNNVVLGNKAKEQRDVNVDLMIDRLNKTEEFFTLSFWNTSFTELVRTLGSKAKKNAKTLFAFDNIKTKENLPAWKQLHMNIRQFSLYDPDDPNLNIVLDELSKLPIKSMETSDDWKDGTQFKMVFHFENGATGLAKPMRYRREVETSENHYIFDDMERHIAEIAAFQLDKLLGFQRVPPTIGRKVNITSELKPISPKSLNKTIYYSPAGNICFYGKCRQFCNHAYAFCGHPDMIEVSIQSFLPSEKIARRKSWQQPWKRAYSLRRKAYWETNDDLCISVRKRSPFNNGKILQDIIDVHTFDFLTGNKDRHNIATFKQFGNYSFPILYDNGRGFGRQTYDALSILAPLRQCCLIRKSTLLKYIKLYLGDEKLSSLMRKAF
ncbi:extracellular serine/threonine protein CG31145-like [Ruditapes philippinarum]|uniref:extracellular serine/threonine protein CG31145-like n=1 Tax=Ruditapes philippinarum TaxID=129788 RepID=UPI00295BD254|nr:extracellular serine/threonine protein CG31145-like [Ruditapes philippinarum]